MADRKKTEDAASAPGRGGLAQVLLGTLIAALVSLVIFIGNWIRGDVSELRQKQDRVQDELRQATTRVDMLIERLNDRATQEFEVICHADKGTYDATNLRCTFNDGRQPWSYKRIEK